MSTVEAKPVITPDDLLSMPDDDNYELVDGYLVERKTGMASSYVGGHVSWLISGFCEEHALGWVFGASCGYECFPDRPNLVRKPNVSFIRLGRIPGEKLYKGHCPIPPDLVVEARPAHIKVTVVTALP